MLLIYHRLKSQISAFDIQTKIVAVLFLVTVPTYILTTVIQYHSIKPLFETDLRQVGISTAETITSEILRKKLLYLAHPEIEIEKLILQRLYNQPAIMRIDFFVRLPQGWKKIASNLDDPEEGMETPPSVGQPTATLKKEDQLSYWEVWYPIHSSHRIDEVQKSKVVGMVLVHVSTRIIQRLLDSLWQVTTVGAVLSTVLLITLLHFFLKKTIDNEKQLRRFENRNQELSYQLFETQRQLLNLEKLAVIGQLTAKVAHEIGTPLNAINGHLELLAQETQSIIPASSSNRIRILLNEVDRIAQIVRNTLRTSHRPYLKKELLDINQLIQGTLQLLTPRLQKLQVQLELVLSDTLPSLRVQPTDFEQIFLNLINNSLDSLSEKKDKDLLPLLLRISTKTIEDSVIIELFDTGIGLAKAKLAHVAVPFFTTKPAGQGTGLGLAIVEELLAPYEGKLLIDSELGWFKVQLKIPISRNS